MEAVTIKANHIAAYIIYYKHNEGGFKNRPQLSYPFTVYLEITLVLAIR